MPGPALGIGDTAPTKPGLAPIVGGSSSSQSMAPSLQAQVGALLLDSKTWSQLLKTAKGQRAVRDALGSEGQTGLNVQFQRKAKAPGQDRGNGHGCVPIRHYGY